MQNINDVIQFEFKRPNDSFALHNGVYIGRISYIGENFIDVIVLDGLDPATQSRLFSLPSSSVHILKILR